VLNELAHANVSCTFHYLVPEQKQKRKEQDTLNALPFIDSALTQLWRSCRFRFLDK